MDQILRRLTPWVLLALAGIVWFEDALPLGSLRKAVGEVGILRFTLGVLCLYTMFLVIERQRMEERFKSVLGSFKTFYAQHTSGRSGADAAKSLEAIRILVVAVDAADPEVRESAISNLKRLTGKDFGTDSKAWQAWLDEANQEAADRSEGPIG